MASICSSAFSKATNEYVWFYSVQQSLAKEDYDQLSQSNVPESPKPASVKKKPPAEDSLTRQIIDDLRPKAETHT